MDSRLDVSTTYDDYDFLFDTKAPNDHQWLFCIVRDDVLDYLDVDVDGMDQLVAIHVHLFRHDRLGL